MPFIESSTVDMDKNLFLLSAQTAVEAEYLDPKTSTTGVIIISASGRFRITEPDAVYVADGIIPFIQMKQRARATIIESAATEDSGIQELRVGYNFSDSSTATPKTSQVLDEMLKELIRETRECIYESELSGRFASSLALMVRQFGDAAIVSLAPYVFRNGAPSEIASEIIRFLANFNDPGTYKSRLWLIMRALQSTSSWIRDSATLALGAMEDPSAAPYLKSVIDCETNEELKQNMLPVLEHLQHLQ